KVTMEEIADEIGDGFNTYSPSAGNLETGGSVACGAFVRKEYPLEPVKSSRVAARRAVPARPGHATASRRLSTGVRNPGGCPGRIAVPAALPPAPARPGAGR